MIYLLQQSNIHVFPMIQSTYECTEDNLWSNQKYRNKLAPFIGNNEPTASLRIFRNLSHFPFLLCCYNRMQCNKRLYYTSTCAFSECKQWREENLWRRALLSVQNMHIQNPSLFAKFYCFCFQGYAIFISQTACMPYIRFLFWRYLKLKLSKILICGWQKISQIRLRYLNAIMFCV